MIAVQGPNARAQVGALLPAAERAPALALGVFHGRALRVRGGDAYLARTGYTGEDGFEIMLPAPESARSGTSSRPPVCVRADSARATRCGSRLA